MVVWITKADGSKEPFKVNKIKRTARRAGASPKLASEIVREVARSVYDGIPSKEVFRIIMRMLKREEPRVACRYDLKAAIMQLGVAGFNFEQLMAEILKEHGYQAKTNQMVQGFCVQHEIDIVAEKDGVSYLIECKYHHQPGSFTGLKETMYTWARLQDLQKGASAKKCGHFDVAWLITNTKFSTDSMKYASCNGVQLLGWSHPKGASLQELIETKGLYPVTVLQLDPDLLSVLGKNKLLLLRDLLKFDTIRLARMLGLSEQKVKKMQDLASQVLERR